MILSCSHISKAFGTDQILSEVSFHIEDQEKAAIVGINGAGKSTLLKIIVGELNADTGEVVLSKGKTLGYLAQHQDLDSSHTIYEAVLEVKRPILLKRGLNATYEEWIMSAEYIMASGNENVILCERGIRTFETFTRNTLDLQSIPVLNNKTHLPVVIDPSHAGGKWWLVEPMAKAAVAAGADGLMIEVHNNPECALCDGAQSLKPEKFDALLKQIRQIAEVVGKQI